MKKKLDALNTLKFIAYLAGCGMILFGLLEFLWLDEKLIAGIVICDGFFKAGVGLYLGAHLKYEKSSSRKDEDDEDEDD